MCFSGDHGQEMSSTTIGASVAARGREDADEGTGQQHNGGRPSAGNTLTVEPGVVVDEQGNNKRKRKEPAEKRECSICTEEHYTNRCPLLRGPKPTVAYCAAAEDGMGFFQIQAARNNQIVDTF